MTSCSHSKRIMPRGIGRATTLLRTSLYLHRGRLDQAGKLSTSDNYQTDKSSLLHLIISNNDLIQLLEFHCSKSIDNYPPLRGPYQLLSRWLSLQSTWSTVQQPRSQQRYATCQGTTLATAGCRMPLASLGLVVQPARYVCCPNHWIPWWMFLHSSMTGEQWVYDNGRLFEDCSKKMLGWTSQLRYLFSVTWECGNKSQG